MSWRVFRCSAPRHQSRTDLVAYLHRQPSPGQPCALADAGPSTEATAHWSTTGHALSTWRRSRWRGPRHGRGLCVQWISTQGSIICVVSGALAQFGFCFRATRMRMRIPRVRVSGVAARRRHVASIRQAICSGRAAAWVMPPAMPTYPPEAHTASLSRQC